MTGIQVVLHINSGQTFSVLHEIDVVGTSSPAPEPASLSLLAAGGLLLMRRRRV